MPPDRRDPEELSIAAVSRWECVRAWGQVLLCLYDKNGEMKVYALERAQAEALGFEVQLSSREDPSE